MLNNLRLPASHELGKWCAYILVLLAPGSFVVLPMLWIFRHRALWSSGSPRRRLVPNGL